MDDDAELARAFAACERWAYEAAYRIYGRLLHAAAFQILRDADDANDCVHDTLTRLWQRGDAFRIERGSLRAFLAVCVRNEALSRSRKRRRREEIAAASGDAATVPDVAQGVADRADVARAMASLTDKQRQSIVLAYFGQLTHEQIAGQLGEPVGTVKSRLSSALRRLRESFSHEETTHVGS